MRRRISFPFSTLVKTICLFQETDVFETS